MITISNMIVVKNIFYLKNAWVCNGSVEKFRFEKKKNNEGKSPYVDLLST